MNKTQEFENSVDLLKNIIWQYDDKNIRILLENKEAWYNKHYKKFWDNWFSDVFDLRTANDFGLSIWGRILDINFFVPEHPDITLNTEQKRFICRLRYYQLITRCTIPEVNSIMKDMFTSDDGGKVYALDPLDMSCILYVFTYQPDAAIAFILLKYDLLPRPATVGIDFRIIRYKPFGFGRFNQNFGNAPFWDGGRLEWPYSEILNKE